MSIAIIAEHRELERVARSFLDRRRARTAARSFLEAPADALPEFWAELTALGWTGLHLPEDYGGGGGGLPELVVVVEALGRVVAPGPFLPTVLTSAIVAACGDDAQRRAWLPGLADGSLIGATGLEGSLERSSDGTLEGSAGLILSAEVATLLALPVDDDLVLLQPTHPGIVIDVAKNLDPTRRVATVRCTGVRPRPDATLRGALPTARRIGRTLAAAEACGGAAACTEMATEYAKVREQFGRPIGSFQAVGHHCANMLVATELAIAAAWDAARADHDDDAGRLAAAAAAAVALPAFSRCAKLSIQVHGGIGYTWEHDAHLYLRRAAALAAIFDPAHEAATEVARLRSHGVRREPILELPADAERHRDEARAFLARYHSLGRDERRAALADEGYLMPHWPRPWGRAAGPIEQLAIEEVLADVERPELGIGAWILASLVQHATPEQIERWVRPTLVGTLQWCQLFSEPGAGSDAAAIQTRGVRVDGGWSVRGQKVWTSGARGADCGLATIRTATDVPKHAGITVMVIDMHAQGVEVRPLREITGAALFNEVFLDDVFVPDQDVVGAVDDGWRVARSTLGNERVSIGGGRYGFAPDLAGLLARRAPGGPVEWRDAGALLAEGQALAMIRLRQAARAVAGDESRADGVVAKLLSSEHAQRVGDLCMRLIGDEAALLEGDAAAISYAHLFLPCLTIGGGTSEIMRNQIAERLLGLPRNAT